MKWIFTLTICLCSLFSTAQGTLEYKLKVLNNKGGPLSGAKVRLIETKTGETMSLKTNGSGYVAVTLDHGAEWALSVNDMINCKYLEVPQGKGNGSGTVTYDMKVYERLRRPAVDRSKIKLETIDQRAENRNRPDEKNSVIKIQVEKDNRSRLKNFPINLTCYKLGKTYLGKTNSTGIATFVVPVANDYEIDVDGIESFSWCDISKQPMLISRVVVYEPTNIKETTKDGYIVQELPQRLEPTSSRARIQITVRGGEKNGVNEDVYLQALKSNHVYRAKTDENGTASFLLPIKRKYMVHFNFHKDVDVIDLSKVRGLAWEEMTLTYRPDPRLAHPERYIPTPDRLVLKAFEEFMDKQYPDPKEDYMDFYLKWGNKVNAKSKEALLEIGFRTKSDPSKITKPGPPINVCFVIDKSGSMAGGEKIDKLKESMVTFIQSLRPTDKVSIVVFDSDASVLVSPMKVGQGKHLINVVRSIEAGGGTNIFNGMVLGYEQVLKNKISGGTNRVVLLTDGYGSTPPAQVVSKSKEFNAKGMELSAVGVGGGYNQALLAQLATAGGGLIHYAGTAEDIDKAFTNELSSVLYPVAKEGVVEVLYNNKIIYRQLYGYDISSKTDGKVVIKMDNLYPGLNKMAMVKFDLHEPTKSILNKPIEVRLSYKDFSKDKVVTKSKKAHLEWNDATGELDMIIDQKQKKMYMIAVINQSLKVMAEAFEEQKYGAARKAVDSALKQVKQIFPEAKDEDIKALVDQMEEYTMAFDNLAAKHKQMH